MNTRNRTDRLLFCVLLFLTVGASASAYVDPGTGSLFVQVLIAGTLGAIFALKNLWRNMWRAVTHRQVRQEAHHTPGDGE
jgi:hypothetical protein